MAFKLSILGFTAIAFVGPILLFVSALLVYRRVRWHKKQLALHDIGLNDNGWHELLKQKSDPSKLSSINLAGVPLVVVEGKRSSSRLGSGVLAVGSPASTTSGSATITTSTSTSTSDRSRAGSPDVSPQHSLRGSSLLTPPPAAVHLPDTQLQPQPAHLQPQQGDGSDQQASGAQQAPPGGEQAHCVLQMPPSDATQAPAAAAPAPSMLQGAAGYVAAMLTAHTYALGRAALGGTAGSGGAAPQQQAAPRGTA